MAMRAIASQLAGAVGNARLLIGDTGLSIDINGQYANQFFGMPGPLKGQVASFGCAFAPAPGFDRRPFGRGRDTEMRNFISH